MVSNPSRPLRVAAVLAAVIGAHACGTRYAQTAEEVFASEGGLDTGTPETSASGTGGLDTGAPNTEATVPCGTLADRIATTTVDVDQDIRYKRAGYNFIPEDERIGFAVAPGGTGALVAWLDNAVANVHITPLTASMARAGSDTPVVGVDIGGIVAQADGFAMITQRDDPQPLIDPNTTTPAKAVFFVRVLGGRESLAVALTGLTSIVTGQPDNHRRDCAPSSKIRVPLNGRLAFNGTAYGAYFAVLGCAGDFEASFYGDKLVYTTDLGQYVPGGWDWGCSQSEGMRLLPETSGVFTSLCMSTGAPYPGLNLLIGTKPSVQLAPEYGFSGFSAGQFGSVVKMGDGSYVIAWLSRGVMGTTAAKAAPDIAMIHLAPDYTPIGTMHWVVETPLVAESNLHLAPYGTDRVLVAWDTLENLVFDTDLAGSATGTYTGTHFRLMDATGTFLTDDENIPSPPNGSEDIATFPNQDLGWAYVAEDDRSNVTKYPGPVIDAAPPVPAKRRITIAHLRYCSQ